MRPIDSGALKDSLHKALKKGDRELLSLSGFMKLIDMQPTIKFYHSPNAVEVVRCKDCMFNHWHETPHGEKYHICNLNQLSFSEHDDFYCAYGERREDD